MTRPETYPEIAVASRAQLREVLADATGPGFWAVTWKKGRGPHVSYDEVVEEALCVGWVDSRGRRIDEDRTALLLTPRRSGSRWAGTNKARVARLTEAGLMRPAGLAAVEEAKASGAWTALDDVENLVEPADLRAALDAVPEARVHWDGFSRSARRSLLDWISTAKRDATRAGRIARTVTEAAAGRRADER
ncbi:YdeI/OmpD-associated family protein [Pseudonocardia sp.]|uniref:YdeI/OmpD-associated family protein n=1 Tax=Pseudonocardia sp. TaxID=60912 RepID=UPI003D12F539